jgi:hypothetical protein
MSRPVAAPPVPLASYAELGALPADCAGLLTIAMCDLYAQLRCSTDPALSRRKRDQAARLALNELDALAARLRAIRDAPPTQPSVSPPQGES